MIAFDHLSPFEATVAWEVFGRDQAGVGEGWYRFSICASRAGPVIGDGGVCFAASTGLGALRRADIVIVPPTSAPAAVGDDVLRALRAAHRRGARIVSLCTGAFVLAAAGLLDGRRAATHWSSAERLERLHPLVEVDPNVLYVDEGDILTSAGSAASIDLCLHIVRSDFGAEVAARIARHLVVAPHRAGGQAQFIEIPVPRVVDGDLFADTFTWMQDHLGEEVTVDDLANRAAMSPRSFARHFRATTGATPYQWLLNQRIGLAQRLLEQGTSSIEEIAVSSGFGTSTNLRKHFQRVVRTSPQAYRACFQSELAC